MDAVTPVTNPSRPLTRNVFPDLSISKFSVSPRRIISGESIKLSAFVENSGKRPLQMSLLNFTMRKQAIPGQGCGDCEWSGS